jgi:hypothetical protein
MAASAHGWVVPFLLPPILESPLQWGFQQGHVHYMCSGPSMASPNAVVCLVRENECIPLLVGTLIRILHCKRWCSSCTPVKAEDWTSTALSLNIEWNVKGKVQNQCFLSSLSNSDTKSCQPWPTIRPGSAFCPEWMTSPSFKDSYWHCVAPQEAGMLPFYLLFIGVSSHVSESAKIKQGRHRKG